MLSEKMQWDAFGSTAIIYEQVIRWIGGIGSKISISKSVAGDCFCRKAYLFFPVVFLGGVFTFSLTNFLRLNF